MEFDTNSCPFTMPDRLRHLMISICICILSDTTFNSIFFGQGPVISGTSILQEISATIKYILLY